MLYEVITSRHLRVPYQGLEDELAAGGDHIGQGDAAGIGGTDPVPADLFQMRIDSYNFV